MQEYCLPCRLAGLSGVGVVALPSLVLCVLALLVALLLEETTGVKQVRQVWVSSYTGLLLTQLRVLFDFVQVVALSLLIRSRAFPWFFSVVLALTGGGLGGGLATSTWQPFLCILPHSDPLWPQLLISLLALPLAALTASASRVWSWLAWRKAGGVSAHSWSRRFLLSLALWLTSVSVCVMRAAIVALSQSHTQTLAHTAVAAAALACFGLASVSPPLFALMSLKQQRGLGFVASTAIAGYSKGQNRFLFELVFLGRKLSLIALGVYVHDPFLASLLSLLLSVALWLPTLLWKPFPRQLHYRTLQAAVMALQVLLLLQASEHASRPTATAIHAAFLAGLCTALLAASVSAVRVVWALCHPPVSLVREGLKLRGGFYAQEIKLALTHTRGHAHTHTQREAQTHTWARGDRVLMSGVASQVK